MTRSEAQSIGERGGTPARVALLLATFGCAASLCSCGGAAGAGTATTPQPARAAAGASHGATRPTAPARIKRTASRGARYSILYCGTPSRRQVALTFDDGPHPTFTPRLLQLLKRQKVKATFFVVGEMADQCPQLVRQEVLEGHCVGNHTMHHANLARLPQDRVAEEIRACGQAIRHITGRAPHLFRPPGGDYNRRVARSATERGYTTVLWTANSGDYLNPGSKAIQRKLLRRLGNGGIILMHDGVPQTLSVLPQLIKTLRAKGYEFVTIDQMIKDKQQSRSRTRATQSPRRPSGRPAHRVG